MAAWAGMLAYTGFQYSAVNKTMNFNSKDGNYFWSNGYQFGTVVVESPSNGKTVVLTVENGDLTLKSFTLNGFGKARFKKEKTFKKGDRVQFSVSSNDINAGLPANMTLK